MRCMFKRSKGPQERFYNLGYRVFHRVSVILEPLGQNIRLRELVRGIFLG